MDDDEAFLYGDDAPETQADGSQAVNGPVPQPKTQTPLNRTSPLPALLPNFLHSFDQVPHPGQIPPNAYVSQESLPVVNQSYPTEPTNALLPPIHTTIDDPQTELSEDPDAEGVPDDKDEDAHGEDNEGEEEEEEEEHEQDQADESDEDLDIILENEAPQVPIPTSSRASAAPSRFETPRDSIPLNRPLDDYNATTEYKPLERVELKLSEPVPVQPLRANPIPILPANPAARQAIQTSTHSHNRLPTPENFPVSVTPPPQPPAPEMMAPDVQVDNPVIPSGYDDKDGSALMSYDFDAISESEKGWKKPGAHIADWFNYGFDETTWRLYVMKQKRMRKEEGWAGNPFAAFATGNIEQAWQGLPSELKDVMMGVIMGNSSGSRNNNHPPQMPASMPSMMVMNPMMQGMEMGGYGMQGMPNVMGGGNPPMNGGHNNSGLNNQLNEGANRVIKQDPGGASEQAGDAHSHYGDEMNTREQHHHEQQRLQDQMRHMQHMHHMGMGAGFMPGMDLAAMFGNQEHQMFMNGPSFNGMMEMPQMPHIAHMPSPMQQQIGPGPPAMNMSMPQNLNPPTSTTHVNPTVVPQPPPQAIPAVRPESPGINTPASTTAPGAVNHTATPGGSPRAIAMPSPAGGRGRGVRAGRGRGNAQASAFLAAAAARGRGRVISASNSVTPLIPVTTTSTPSPKVEAPAQLSPPHPTSSTPVSSGPSVAEASTDRPSVRPVSPLPSNVPTGPRRAVPPANPVPPRGPRTGTGGYFDKDAAGARGDEGLDYGGGPGGGGGVGTSPQDDRQPSSRRHSHRSERDKSNNKDADRSLEKAEDPSERSRSKSRDKDLEDKDGSHKPKSSRHRHRASSKSKDPEYHSNREKDKEDGGTHKPSRSSNGGRRSRRSRQGHEGSKDKEDDCDPHETAGDGENKDKEKHNKVKEWDREKERDRDRERDREIRERDRDDDDVKGDYSAPTNPGSRKRKPKDDRSNRSKRERAD